MILIIDNGGEYEDHKLLFVQADPTVEGEVRAALRQWAPDAEIIARVTSVEWCFNDDYASKWRKPPHTLSVTELLNRLQHEGI